MSNTSKGIRATILYGLFLDCFDGRIESCCLSAGASQAPFTHNFRGKKYGIYVYVLYMVFPKIGVYTPKSSILRRFSIINHPFWGTTIFGNIHII